MPATIDREALDAAWNAATDKRRGKGTAKAAAVAALEDRRAAGRDGAAAIRAASREHGASASDIYRWRKRVDGHPRDLWPAILMPRHKGRTATAACSPEALDFINSDYLRAEAPSFASCYRRLLDAAEGRRWAVPPLKTLHRHLNREVPVAVQVLARRGQDAAKQLYPAQRRSKLHLAALECVNADGHKFDVFVRFEDGTIGRPVGVCIQDTYSDKMLSWRIDRTENRDTVRLAFGDLVREFGIPRRATLDNGRSFASKWLTGGLANRYRFKIKEEEPSGILKQLGIEVHWTFPYSGQSKPIERAFRDFCDHIAKHPALAGAYVGNAPDAKPENYGSRAVPIQEFRQLVATEFARHNARQGRRTETAKGRSFNDTFNESYAAASPPIVRATEAQLELFLLAAESVFVSRPHGVVDLFGNRYWDAFLNEFVGKHLVARFDPDRLKRGIVIYDSAGRRLGVAPVVEDAGFDDTDAAREHNRNRREFLKGLKRARDAAVTLKPEELAAMLPKAEPGPVPAAKIIEPFRREAPEAPPLTARERQVHERLLAEHEAGPPPPKQTIFDRAWQRALEAEARLARGETLDAGEAEWLAGYQGTPDYKNRKRMAAFEAEFERSMDSRARPA